jgi:hypothetical protein
VYYQFLANVKYMGLQGHIVPLPNTSRIVARWLAHWRVTADMVYIDANHDEDDVYRDLVNYWSLVRPGGVLFGDDYWTAVGPGVINAVDRFARETQQPLTVMDSKWVMRKPNPASQAAPALTQAVPEPAAPAAVRAAEAPAASLAAQVGALSTQLAAAECARLAAVRELEAVQATRAYRLMAAYWMGSTRLRRALRAALGRGR